MEELDDIPEKATVIIRSHGVSRAAYEAIAGKRGAEIVDATCPFVIKNPQYCEAGQVQSGQADCDHRRCKTPRGSKAICGWCVHRHKYTCFRPQKRHSDLQLRPTAGQSLVVVSQTTFNYNKFKELVEIISEKGLQYYYS